MPLGFQLFRQVLCITLAFCAAISLCLGIYLSQFFVRQGLLWLLVTVEVLSFLRSLWSITRKPIFNAPQPVASEAVGLFVLFPFQLIVALLLSGITLKHGSNTLVFIFLRVFAISNAAIHMVYTVGLVMMAILTVPAFDADVWLRDIDSSPSPFPLAIIFAFVFPCIARRFEATRAFVSQPVPQERPTQCLATCLPNCTIHGSSPYIICKPTPSNVENGLTAEVHQAVLPTEEINRSLPILPHTLIRIPNAAERRASIYVDLQIRGLEAP
ncbi:hypothetical protein BDZ97DRAFT_1787477 [Flammula alnicola]|nr:hypothetical protein BDZ97DRAFT_1787477 [Flammula alnicola]